MPETRRRWRNINRFQDTHRRDLEQAEEYFVIAHDLRNPVLLSSTWLRYHGVLSCHGGIEIHVNHQLVRDHSNRVRTAVVSYHAQITEFEVVHIVRYDNAHDYPDHPDAFHKHLFDAAGKPAGVEHIGRDNFPTLRQVIDEVFNWWKANRDDPRYYPK